MSTSGLVQLKIRHGGKFVGCDKYVGGDLQLIEEWDLMEYGYAFFGEIFSLRCPYSRIQKAALRKGKKKQFDFLNLEQEKFSEDLTQYVDKKNMVLDVFVEFDTNIAGDILREELNDEQPSNDEQRDGEERAELNDGLPTNEYEEDDDLDDGLSTDEEWEEARKILREDRKRSSAENDTLEGDGVTNEEQVFSENVAEKRVCDNGAGDVYSTMSPVEEIELDIDEELDQLKDDDDDPRSKMNRKLYVKTSKPGELKLELGLTFRDNNECQQAVKNWAIENGYDIKWAKSARGKLQAVCRGNCAWKLYASKERLEPTCVIRTLVEPHECSRVRKNRQINAEWLAEYFMPKLRVNPNYTAHEMVADIFQMYEAEVNLAICYRAKEKALELISGTLNEHYAKILPYVTELKKIDKEGRFQLMTHLNAEGGRVFDRIYVGFSALKNGFFIGCRRFVGFDACFLKTILGGVLLAAVSKNGDNKMYPIAWAVVEKENEATWKWFFEILFQELNVRDGEGWTFMSDKQKGLINGIASLAPRAEHRHCARHIYANWRKKFSGPKFKGLLWANVRATTTSQYNYCLMKLREESQEAADDFETKGPTAFCKSLIDSFTRTDLVVNNICECFNAYILKGRDKPLIDLLEYIRINLMSRTYHLAKALATSNDELTPYTRKKLRKIQELVRYCLIRPSIGDMYEVALFDDTVVVDLQKRECSCRWWELTGLPCCHALSCILHRREEVEMYIDSFYKKSTMLECYKHGISPLRGSRDWQLVDQPPILPPQFTRLPGRPKKVRKRAADEIADVSGPKLSYKGMKMSCRNCGSFEHNRRTCKAPPKEGQGEASNETTRLNPTPSTDQAKKNKSKATAKQPIPTSTRETRSSSSKAKEKDQRTARKGIGTFVSPETGNIYYKSSGKSRVRYVSGRQAGTASRLKKQASDVVSGSQSSQVIDAQQPPT